MSSFASFPHKISHSYPPSLIPETRGRSLEEMDVVFGSVEQSKREADITERQRALDEQQPSSVHSETVDAKA